VRNRILAFASAAILALAIPEALALGTGNVTRAELQALEAQVQARMQEFAERLGRLEGENAELRAVVALRDAEIDALKAQSSELREQGAEAAGEIAKAKGADWATRIGFKGDLRVRGESIRTERVAGSGPGATVEDAADRNRMRYRARLSADARVTERTKVVLGIASGDGDPRSTNQTFTDTGSGKGVRFDLAYADWAFAPGAHLVLGKHRQPFRRTGQSLFFDTDINPEGAAVTYERGMFFGSAYAWWLQEGHSPDPADNDEDATLLGAQGGIAFPLAGGETRLAAHYYDCGGCRHGTPFWSGGGPYGNTTVPRETDDGTVQVLKYDYDVMVLSGQVNLTLLGRPVLMWADWARNLASGVQYDTAYNLGAFFGSTSAPRSWEAGLMYQSMDKDAMFAQLIDSDFAAGNTDGDGWLIKVGYAPVRNVVLNATYMINSLNKDVAPVAGPGFETGRDLDFDRLQLDVNYRF
jgi:hypothetical protein